MDDVALADGQVFCREGMGNHVQNFELKAKVRVAMAHLIIQFSF